MRKPPVFPPTAPLNRRMLSKSLAGATLKPLILSMLMEGPKYGFQLVYRARQLYDGQVAWSNSKLYPILHRMEHDGWVESFWQASEEGPDRKYYRITEDGKKALATVQKQWKMVNDVWAELWGPETAAG